jgi:hypothetical protein
MNLLKRYSRIKMDRDTFTQVVNDRFDKCKKMLTEKAELYAHGDRLSNFKKAANLSGCTPVYAAWGMAVKHVIALSDYIAELEDAKLYPEDQWDEKITDIINYLILIEALIREGYFADTLRRHG